ncbi:MAG: ABC transporter ATP-binding protein [Enterobacteriaceae bacterium]|jgi:ABC-type dipeptide/oligopeptide/nickel transport system ATPase component|nr:ABC transporter ATP-binding protein [Enterobacteriaceae bacterium]
MENLLQVENLTIATNTGLELVRNVSFTVQKNEIVVLLGQSGSGKTMTSMAILDLLPAGIIKTSGTIRLGGEINRTDICGRIASMVMQAPASCFDPVFTIRTQLTDILKSHGKEALCTDRHFSKMMADVELDNPQEILSAYPFQLSGGMLQRLMIALTLALETPLIIADEPTSDLDLPAQAEILNLLMAIDRRNKGILMITHDMSVALRMADRVLVMNEGTIVDSFDIKDIYATHRHHYTQSLIAANLGLCDNPWHINLGGAHA